MPLLDNIESKLSRDESGAEVTNWFMQVNPQFKHLNVCLNQIDDTALEAINDLLSITPDDFQLTLSGNAFADESVQSIYSTIRSVHKQRVTEQRLSDPSSTVQETADIAQRRAAF